MSDCKQCDMRVFLAEKHLALPYCQVFPEHKYLIVQCLRRCGFAVAMTGDGVNDAPALKRADCGVAVQGSTDAARAAADIVLTQPGLKTVVDAIVVARCIFQCVGAAVRQLHATQHQALTSLQRSTNSASLQRKSLQLFIRLGTNLISCCLLPPAMSAGA